ncbi:MAG: hypothetical protein HKO67_13600, partial [Flavobacteriaceae bacterium]|nr:hypothetical protein [Flavobacteriaceae bacterium]
MKSLNFLLLAILALHLQAYSLQVPRKDTLIQGRSLRIQDRPNQTPQVLIDPVNPVRLPSSSVQLRGSVKNVDSKSVLYIWTQISGPMIAKIGSPEKSVTRVTNLQETGVYRFKLSIYRVVVNGSTKYNVLDDAFVDIKVIENRSPIVNAGPDQTVILPVNRVNLQGSARDPEGDNFGFRWRQSSGPMQALIQSPTQSSTQVNNLDEEGTYRFQLTVTDNRKGMGRDFVDVIVIRNNSPRANAGTDQLIVLPVNRVSLRGRGRDPDGDNIAFRWSQISGPMQTFIQTPTQSSTQVSNLNEEGIYRFQLTVSDGKNGEDNDVVNVTVRRNLPPIANAGSDQTITLPNNRVQLIGSGEDPDSDNLVYSWRQPDGPMEAIIETPDQLITEINGLTREGTYRFQLTIIDDMQGSDSDMVSVTVLPIPVQPISPPTV